MVKTIINGIVSILKLILRCEGIMTEFQKASMQIGNLKVALCDQTGIRKIYSILLIGSILKVAIV